MEIIYSIEEAYEVFSKREYVFMHKKQDVSGDKVSFVPVFAMKRVEQFPVISGHRVVGFQYSELQELVLGSKSEKDAQFYDGVDFEKMWEEYMISEKVEENDFIFVRNKETSDAVNNVIFLQNILH